MYKVTHCMSMLSWSPPPHGSICALPGDPCTPATLSVPRDTPMANLFVYTHLADLSGCMHGWSCAQAFLTARAPLKELSQYAWPTPRAHLLSRPFATQS